MNKNRFEAIDICRGIGAVSIVVGHVCYPITQGEPVLELIRRFVYLYHLSVFFYCSGFCFKKTSFTGFVKNIIRKYYVPFVLIEGLSVILYPLWSLLRIVPQSSFSEILIKFARIILFLPAENLVGALWFVPFLAVTLLIFYLILCFCDRISIFRQFNDGIIIATTFIIGFSGSILVMNYGIGRYFLFIAMLMQPLVLLGYLARKYTCSNALISPRALVIPSFIILMFCVVFSTNEIELSKGEIFGNPFLFYIVSSIGIIFCLGLSSVIVKCKPLSRWMQYIGRMSFYLMAFQFVAFKLIDAIFGFFYTGSKDILVMFPYSFAQLRLLYIVFAIMFSLLLGQIGRYGISLYLDLPSKTPNSNCKHQF